MRINRGGVIVCVVASARENGISSNGVHRAISASWRASVYPSTDRDKHRSRHIYTCRSGTEFSAKQAKFRANPPIWYHDLRDTGIVSPAIVHGLVRCHDALSDAMS